MICCAIPIFITWKHLDPAYVVIGPILVGIIVPSASRIGSAMEQVKICLASGLLGFLCSIPFQDVIWLNARTPWIGVGWIVIVGFFGAVLVTWLDPKMSSLPILRLALLYICVAVTFAPSPSQSNGGKSEHWSPAVQMLLIHLYSAAIALVFALAAPFVSSQINRDFANITTNCSILFEEMCDQLRLTKQDSIENDPTLMDISAEQNLLEFDALRRKEEKKVRALERYLGRRMKALKTIMSEAQLELWADPVLVHNYDAIYSNLDRLLRDFMQMRLALETGFIPRLSLVLIQPLIPGISLLRDTTRDYLAIIEHSLDNMFDPNLKRHAPGSRHGMTPLDAALNSKVPSRSTIVAHSGIASDSDANLVHESHVVFHPDTKFYDMTLGADDVPPRRKRRSHRSTEGHEAEGLKNQHFKVHHDHPHHDDTDNDEEMVAVDINKFTPSSTPTKAPKADKSKHDSSSSEDDDENDDDDDKEEAEKERRRRRRRERRIQRKQRISISEGTSQYEDYEGHSASDRESTTRQQHPNHPHPRLRNPPQREHHRHQQHHHHRRVSSGGGTTTDQSVTSGTEYFTSDAEDHHQDHHEHEDHDHQQDHHHQDQNAESSGTTSATTTTTDDNLTIHLSRPHPFIKNPTLIESETMTLSKQTARITQAISKEYIDTMKARLSKSELKLSPTAELTRLNFFLWRIAEMRKRLKSLEHAVNFQVRHARVLGEWWSFKATLQSIFVPFFSFFQGVVSVLYMGTALFIRFMLWIFHHCCCRSVRWENMRWFGRRAQTKVKDPSTGTTLIVLSGSPSTIPADPSYIAENSGPTGTPRNSSPPRSSSRASANASSPISESSSSQKGASAKQNINQVPLEFISDLELDESRTSLALNPLAHPYPTSLATPSSSTSRPQASNTTPNVPASSSPIISTRMSSTSAAAAMDAPQFNTSFAKSSKTSMTSSAAQHHAQLSQAQQAGPSSAAYASSVNPTTTTGAEDAAEVRIELPEPSIAKVGHFRIGKGVKLSDRFMHDWIGSGGWRFAVRLGVALAVASAGAMAVQLYAFPKIRVSWVCITTLIVFAPELGGTMKRVLHRIAGTIGGAICALVTVLFAKYTHRFLVFGPFLVFTFLVTYAQHSAYKPRPYTWTVANFTYALIVMLSWPFNESAGEYAILAGERGLQVLIGCILVVAASYLVFPDRAETPLRQKLTLQTQHSVHAFIEMIALTHSAIQETGKITGLVQRTWDLIFPCAQLLKLAKAEQITLFAKSAAKRQTLVNITKQLETLSDTLVQMHDTLRAGFSPALRDWVAPYCELLTRATLFIEEDALLIYTYLSTGKMDFRPEPTRIPAILQQMDSCYLELRSNNPRLGDLYPEAFRWNAFMHTAREFIVAFSNLVVFVTEPEQHNQLIHMYSR